MSICRGDFSDEQAGAIEMLAKRLRLTFASAVRVLVEQSLAGVPNGGHKQNGSETLAEPSRNGSETLAKREQKGDIGVSVASSIDTVVVPGGSKGGKPRHTGRPAPDPEFDEFWRVYPRKTGKKAARRAWDGVIDRPPLSYLLDALRAQVHAYAWPTQFTPHASTWLNGERWTDEDPRIAPALRAPSAPQADPPARQSERVRIQERVLKERGALGRERYDRLMEAAQQAGKASELAAIEKELDEPV